MKKESKQTECCQTDKKCRCRSHGDPGAIYGLGVIGALFYFLSHATSFGMVLLGIGKSIFWPAILMFELLTYLGL